MWSVSEHAKVRAHFAFSKKLNMVSAREQSPTQKCLRICCKRPPGSQEATRRSVVR